MQPSLFGPPSPRLRVLHSGVTLESREASHEAGARAQRSGSAASQRARLLAAYRAAGPYGVTDGELSERLGIRRYVVPARRAELRREYRFTAIGRRAGSTAWLLEG